MVNTYMDQEDVDAKAPIDPQDSGICVYNYECGV
jgi:hypothetical protein